MQASCIPMDYWFLAFSLSILCLPSDAQSEDTERPVMTIPQGMLRGKIMKTHNGRNISAYMGIPYAEPPMGDLRFANPVMARGWNGIRDASRDASMCLQSKLTILGNEDCLYINVYTPKCSQNLNLPLMPVMVYIHGGALLFGSSISSSYGPDYLLCEDVILVTLNYRLNALGFLSTGDETAPGNWGLKDQVLALKWVQNNIEYFGGDPNRVTIFGESSGGVSVHLLTLSKSTIGLYHRFITQSGSALAYSVYQSRAACAEIAFELGKFVGCSNNTTKSLINCLKTLNASDILVAISNYEAENKDRSLTWTLTDEPDIEGAFLTDSPNNLLANGQMRDLPWICGINRDDGLSCAGAYYRTPELFDAFLENMNTSLATLLGYTNLSRTEIAQLNAIESFYFPDLTANKSLLLANLTTLLGDFTFVYPEYKTIRHGLSTAVSPRFLYSFNYRGTFSLSYDYTGSRKDYGVAHADDLIYLFPTPMTYTTDVNETMNKSDWEMVDIMVKLWTSFARDGKPTIPPLNYTATWKPFSTMDNYLEIGDESKTTIRSRHPFLKQRMQFWTNLYAAKETPTIESNDSETTV